MTVSTIPVAAYAPEIVGQLDNSSNGLLNTSLLFVVFVAIAYAVWEWRDEIVRIVVKKKS